MSDVCEKRNPTSFFFDRRRFTKGFQEPVQHSTISPIVYGQLRVLRELRLDSWLHLPPNIT